MIILISSIKGGVGKTTVATNIACYLAQRADDVILVDADYQGTATDFNAARSNQDVEQFSTVHIRGESIGAELEKLNQKYKFVVVDVMGADSTELRASLVVADKVLFIQKPQAFSMWTNDKVATLISQVKILKPELKVFSAINLGYAQGDDNQEALEMLKEDPNTNLINSVLVTRKAYADAGAQGLAINELPRRNKKAIDEFDKLFIEFIGA